jgi:hypothetical protein
MTKEVAGMTEGVDFRIPRKYRFLRKLLARAGMTDRVK